MFRFLFLAPYARTTRYEEGFLPIGKKRPRSLRSLGLALLLLTGTRVSLRLGRYGSQTGVGLPLLQCWVPLSVCFSSVLAWMGLSVARNKEACPISYHIPCITYLAVRSIRIISSFKIRPENSVLLYTLIFARAFGIFCCFCLISYHIPGSSWHTYHII